MRDVKIGLTPLGTDFLVFLWWLIFDSDIFSLRCEILNFIRFRQMPNYTTEKSPAAFERATVELQIIFQTWF